MTSIETLQEFKNLGCSDQLQIALACRIFQDLQHSSTYKKIDKAYNEELDVIYLNGCQNGKSHVFLPLLSSQDFDMCELERLQLTLDKLYAECTLHLAICDGASNVLYYTISQGFVDDPESWQEKN